MKGIVSSIHVRVKGYVIVFGFVSLTVTSSLTGQVGISRPVIREVISSVRVCVIKSFRTRSFSSFGYFDFSVLFIGYDYFDSLKAI